MGLGALDADVADGVGLVNVERAESLSRREIRLTYCEPEFVSEVRCLLLGKPRRSRAPAAQIRIGVSLMPRVWPRYLLNSSCPFSVGPPQAIPRYNNRKDLFGSGKAYMM